MFPDARAMYTHVSVTLAVQLLTSLDLEVISCNQKSFSFDVSFAQIIELQLPSFFGNFDARQAAASLPSSMGFSLSYYDHDHQ